MTYSIVARDAKTGDLGVCVATTVAGVGALAPQVSLRAAACSQAFVNVDLGLEIMERAEAGQSVAQAVAEAIASDPGAEQRQLIAIGADGATAGFTGQDVLPWHGHLLRVDHAIAGNLLTSSSVLEAMSRAFEERSGEEFVSRLIASVEAGLEAGGEVDAEEFKDTVASAAVIVASDVPKAYHNLRVDASLDPLADLRIVYNRARASAKALDDFYDGAITVRPTFWRQVWNGGGTQ